MDTMLLGTFATAAPEQFGARRSDMRSDVFGIGMLIMYLLTNDVDLEALKTCGAPFRLKRVIRRCTCFDPARRYPSLKELQRDLRRGQCWKRRFFAFFIMLTFVSGMAMCIKTATDRRAIEIARSDAQFVSFTEPLIEQAVSYRLGLQPGTLTEDDLSRVYTLLLGGDTPFDDWDDVECYSQDGTFINLPTSSRRLSRGNVKSLADLRMLPNLRQLALYGQDITDVSVLNEMPLTHLALGDNPIEDFSTLASLKQLIFLNLAGTGFKDASVLSECVALKSLNIYDTPLWDMSPLTNLPIRELNLDYKNIRDDDAILTGFPGLTLLRLNHAPESMLNTIGRLIHLEFLDLPGYPGETLEPLGDLTRLRTLVAGGGRLRSLAGVEDMTSLEILIIVHSAVSDLTPLFGLSHLQNLSIGNNKISDYEQLRNIPALRQVGVSTTTEFALFQEAEWPFLVVMEDW